MLPASQCLIQGNGIGKEQLLLCHVEGNREATCHVQRIATRVDHIAVDRHDGRPGGRRETVRSRFLVASSKHGREEQHKRKQGYRPSAAPSEREHPGNHSERNEGREERSVGGKLRRLFGRRPKGLPGKLRPTPGRIR